ncbi:MAG: hypothetical protein HGB12_02020 [Bacteroidetes bacterium]|nr:hypothetical protein [Bacteroidota bacterium]
MTNKATTLLLKLKTITVITSILVFILCYSRISQAQVFKSIDSTELRLSYNSKTTVLDSGKLQTEFHEKWINYMDENNTWKEIDPVFVKTDKGFEMNEAPFEVLAPLYADETAIFNNNNRYDVFADKIIYDKPLEQTIQALGTAHVKGITETGDLGWGKAQYVVYPNAYPEIQADLIYWVHQGVAPRLRKFIRFNQKLTENTDFQFRVIYSDEVETVNNGKNVTVTLKEVNSKRGNGWANFYIWDSKGGWAEKKSIRYDFEKQMLTSTTDITIDPNEYILTKHIDADYFKTASLPVFTDATSTFYPDANTETTSVDGNSENYSSASWATSHDATSAPVYDNTATANVDVEKPGANWWISRIYLLFYTNSIPDADIIISANLSLWATSVIDGDNDAQGYISIITSNPASNNALITDDYDQVGTVSQANVVDLTEMSTGAYTDWTLNSTGLSNISKNGVSKFGAREGHDVENISNNNGTTSRVDFYMADQSGTLNDPKLVIVHDAPSTPATVDWNSSNVQEITLSASRSLTFTNGKSGGVYHLIVKQDGAGGWAVSWSSGIKWTSGSAPALTTSANSSALIKFVYDGTNYLEGGINQY